MSMEYKIAGDELITNEIVSMAFLFGDFCNGQRKRLIGIFRARTEGIHLSQYGIGFISHGP